MTIHMRGAGPVLTTARVLVDLQRAARLSQRQIRLGRIPNAGVLVAGQGNRQRQIFQVHGAAIAQFPESARVRGAARIADRDAGSHGCQAGEEVQPHDQIEHAVPAVLERACREDDRTKRPGLFGGHTVDADAERSLLLVFGADA